MRNIVFTLFIFFSNLTFAKSDVFFGTFFSDLKPKNVVDQLQRFGAEKAGQVEMGTVLHGAPYFHFVLPKDNVSDFFEYINKNGKLIIENSQSSDADSSAYTRFIIWLATPEKYRALKPEVLFIHQVSGNPETSRANVKEALTEKGISFVGKKTLLITVKKFSEAEEVLKALGNTGSYLIRQSDTWTKKRIKVTFSKGPGVKKKITTLNLTTTHKESEKALLTILESSNSQKAGNKWKVPNKASNFLKFSEKATVSYIPGRKQTQFADIYLTSTSKYDTTKDLLKSASPQKPSTVKITQPSKAEIEMQKKLLQEKKLAEEKAIADELESIASKRKTEEEQKRITKRDSDYPIKMNIKDELIYFEADPAFKSVSKNPTLRGYYEGKKELIWKKNIVEIKDRKFELPFSEVENYKSTTGVLSIPSDNISKEMSIEKFPANNVQAAGSAFPTAQKKLATMFHFEFEHTWERPFNSNRNSFLFNNLSTIFHATSISNAVSNSNYLEYGIKNRLYLEPTYGKKASGFIGSLNLHNISSGNFNYYMLGLGMEYEFNFPFPLFEYWPKTITPFIETDFWGPNLTFNKSYYLGLKGRMYFTDNFYIHGTLGRLEQDVTHSLNFISTSLSFGLTRFEGGFGYRF